MAAFAPVDIPDSLMEDLRCSLCKGYLSCAPVQLLPNGSSICGICSAFSMEKAAHRQLAFEAILRRASFPCPFQKQGCQQRVPFGSGSEHETSCLYRPFLCPSLPPGKCTWKGPAPEVQAHFSWWHPDLVVDKPDFHVQIDTDSREVLVAEAEDAAFVIRISYAASKHELNYSIACVTLSIKEALFKLTVINSLDPDYCVTLNAKNCLTYNTQQRNLESRTLCLDDILAAINNPDRIAFSVALVVTKLEDNWVTDYESFKLGLPETYPSAAVVGKLKRLQSWISSSVARATPPISEHKAEPRFTFCLCRINNCTEGQYKVDEVLPHLYSHGFLYASDELNYKVTFSAASDTRAIFSLHFNGVIYIHHEGREFEESFHKIVLDPRATRHSTKVTAMLEFEHPRYKFKSKVRMIGPGDSTSKEYLLPSCVKLDDLFTVTLTIY